MKNKWNEENIRKFELENQELLDNDLVVSFLKIPTNKEIYMKTISNPTPENMKELDILFKHFYFKIRFISHISITLKFNSINYDKRVRLLQSRFPTTLDASINSSEGEETFLDLMADEQAENLIGEAIISDDLDEHVTCPIMYEALNSLTKKQKEIINLAYAEGLSDTDIGLILNKTQQAVSKTHKKALKNMLTYIENQKKSGVYDNNKVVDYR
ncbi:sigma-70 family RNA polymerase sigma factor [Lysinibacillus xylanilyticus]|uniref:sigma-70 family RNA polymerase sigma factor n=1 Tax=Lysinibacillus xylanilyticus TaxID=582475 RepID=UPI002B24C6BC|nr:sigma-70 family RNA polymerase sigma factor [Lysinibacillus xylanilyticus]MEB2301544.1 sigma-70 family RNA polymerase sigma factor [Lysinibacillus xylanilyticus]